MMNLENKGNLSQNCTFILEIAKILPPPKIRMERRIDGKDGPWSFSGTKFFSVINSIKIWIFFSFKQNPCVGIRVVEKDSQSVLFWLYFLNTKVFSCSLSLYISLSLEVLIQRREGSSISLDIQIQNWNFRSSLSLLSPSLGFIG